MIMKKIFTLISMALVAMSVNAQKESYTAAIADFNATEVTINKTANVTVVANGGNVLECKTAGSQEVTSTPATWSAKKQGDINFDYVTVGGSVPYVTTGVEEIITDGNPTGNYRPTYTYYEPDGSAGLPINGEYVKLTAKVDGMFKIGFWVNKNEGRKLYLVRESDKKALKWAADATTEYKVEGYINDCNEWADAEKTTKKKKFFSSIVVNDYELGVSDYQSETDVTDDGVTPKIKNQKALAKWGWFVFDAKANETYWVFGNNWQFGFQGYEFTPGETIANYTGISTVKAAANTNAPIYNLAGQKVNNSYKGIAIQNGKKFMVK